MKPDANIPLLYITDRKEWRLWLAGHYTTEKEIWLVYNKKHTGQPRIAYNDAVEEALCFGWIDSIVKSIDEDRYAQRFSPRKPKSKYSQANLERLRVLIGEGKVMPEVMATLDERMGETFEIPEDILAELPEFFAYLYPYTHCLHR